MVQVGRVDRDLVKNLLLGYITSDQNKKLGRPSHNTALNVTYEWYLSCSFFLECFSSGSRYQSVVTDRYRPEFKFIRIFTCYQILVL